MDAHLLMAQIYLAQGNFAMCSHCLELGISHNFKVGVRCVCHPLSILEPVSCSPQPLREQPQEPLHPATLPSAQRQGQALWAPVAFCTPGAVSSSSRELEPHTLSSRSETTRSTTSSRPGSSTSLGII